MSIKLKKGENISLTKEVPGLKKIIVGLGWDVNENDDETDFDLDASAFMIEKNGLCPSENEFIFYGNLEHPSKSVIHQGDNCTGEGEGDDEQILVDLSKIPDNISKIVFTVTIYDAQDRWQNFGQVSNSYIRIINMNTGEEIARYNLGEEFSIETAVIVGELSTVAGEWKFNAIGKGIQGELTAVCANYGIDAE